MYVYFYNGTGYLNDGMWLSRMFVLDFVFVFCYFILQLLDYVEHGR